jgi:hypothetical protein
LAHCWQRGFGGQFKRPYEPCRQLPLGLSNLNGSPFAPKMEGHYPTLRTQASAARWRRTRKAASVADFRLAASARCLRVGRRSQ